MGAHEHWKFRQEYGHVDFEPFFGKFPRNVRPTDIDFCLDNKGNFLFVEFKFGSPRPLSTGQRMLFENLTKLSPKVTAVVLFGDDKAHEYTHSMTIHGGKSYPVVETCLDDFLERTVKWWNRCS